VKQFKLIWVVQPPFEKYFVSQFPQITILSAPFRPEKRDVSRSSRTLGWNAMDAKVLADERRMSRTAKSCGSDFSTLESSLRKILQATVTRKPDHREEREGNR
jgi:hypothetical protein